MLVDNIEMVSWLIDNLIYLILPSQSPDKDTIDVEIAVDCI